MARLLSRVATVPVSVPRKICKIFPVLRFLPVPNGSKRSHFSIGLKKYLSIRFGLDLLIFLVPVLGIGIVATLLLRGYLTQCELWFIFHTPF